MVKFIHNKRDFNKNVLLRKVDEYKELSLYNCGLKGWPSFPKDWFYVKDFHQQIKSKCGEDKTKTLSFA